MKSAARIEHVYKNTRKKIPVNHLVYFAIISPIMTLPQLFTIWTSKTIGISLLTWVAYLTVATIWLIYGVKYKIKPIIVIQTIWIAVDTAIVAGLLIR